MVFLAQEDPTERRPDEVLELLKKMHLPASTPSTGKKFNSSIDHEQAGLGQHSQLPIHHAVYFCPTMGTAPPDHTSSPRFQVACPHWARLADRMKLPRPPASVDPDNPSSTHLGP